VTSIDLFAGVARKNLFASGEAEEHWRSLWQPALRFDTQIELLGMLD
jgi:hypothetical protein